MTSAPIQGRAECPRCGYDQAGAMAAWERLEPARCPVSGLCTECGLEFLWRDRLNPAYREHLRLFEHARWGLMRSLLRTWWRAQRPWSFWRWVRMEHEIVGRRLAVMAVLGPIVTDLAVAAVLWSLVLLSLGLIWMRIPGGALGTDWLEVTRVGLWPYSSWGDHWRDGRIVHPFALLVALSALVLPLTFVLLGDTMRAGRVRRGHVVRIWVYSLVALPGAMAVPMVLQAVHQVAYLSTGGPASRGAMMDRIGFALREGYWWIMMGVGYVWLSAWWVWAAGRYLRLPRAWLVGPVLTLVAMLAMSLPALLLWGMSDANRYDWLPGVQP